MKIPFLFKIGLALSIIGSVWLGIVFLESDRVIQSYTIEPSKTVSVNIPLEDSGVGYYKISISDFLNEAAFIQILDPNGNIIADKRIETKMAVNYFNFENGGTYALKATNLSDVTKIVEIEFGDTNSSQMVVPGIILIVGLVLILFIIFRKVQNYQYLKHQR